MLSVSPISVPPKNFSSIIADEKVAPHVILTKRPDLIEGLPDGILAILAPVVAYWVYSSFFHIIDVYYLAEKYRIHPSPEELAKNKAKLSDVIKDVIIQHIVQTIIGLSMYFIDPTPMTGYELHDMWKLKKWVGFAPDLVIWYVYMYGFSAVKLLVAFCIIDTWQYTLHRYMHINKTLYRMFHSRHHRLQVPFAYGALYNDPVEGFLLDTAGSGLASIVTSLTPRESLLLYTFATMKTVDDHCGYRLPFDPFQMIFPNNSLYHDIHHQSWGFKSNFSQPFFTIWDRILGTKYQFVEEYKQLQDKITLEKYQEFLASRKSKKNM